MSLPVVLASKDWLPEEKLAWFVIDVVSMMDLFAFHVKHPNDSVGRRVYDPEKMLAIWVYSYCAGLRSSCRIAAGCRTDLALKAICCDVVPAHDAIGQFRADHESAIVDVLALCARAGPASFGTVAIDGTKIGSDAALDQNRSESAIRAEVERMVAETGAADVADHVQATLDGCSPRPSPTRRARLGRQRSEQEEKDQHRAEEAEAGRRRRGRTPTVPPAALKKAQADLTAAKVTLGNATSELARVEARRVPASGAEREARPPGSQVRSPLSVSACTHQGEGAIGRQRSRETGRTLGGR